MEAEIQYLMREARIWRIANSAQWVAWGIVQAKIPEMDAHFASLERRESNETTTQSNHGRANLASDPLTPEMQQLAQDAHDKRPDDNNNSLAAEEHAGEGGEEEEEEFDYLAYAQSRAMFFWGDVLGLGIVEAAQLPREIVEGARRVEN